MSADPSAGDRSRLLHELGNELGVVVQLAHLSRGRADGDSTLAADLEAIGRAATRSAEICRELARLEGER